MEAVGPFFTISGKRVGCSLKDEPFFDCFSCRPETALWLFHHYIRCSSLLALLSVLLSNSLGWPSRSPEHRGSSHGLGTQARCLFGGRAFSPQPRDAFGTFRFGGVQRRSPHRQDCLCSVLATDRSRVSRNFRIFFAAQIFYSRGGTASANPGKLRLRFGL